MGLSYNVYLSSPRIYMCKGCKTHLSNHEDIISRVSYFQHAFISMSSPSSDAGCTWELVSAAPELHISSCMLSLISRFTPFLLSDMRTFRLTSSRFFSLCVNE
jgi:hypothetical protein